MNEWIFMLYINRWIFFFFLWRTFLFFPKTWHQSSLTQWAFYDWPNCSQVFVHGQRTVFVWILKGPLYIGRCSWLHCDRSDTAGTVVETTDFWFHHIYMALYLHRWWSCATQLVYAALPGYNAYQLFFISYMILFDTKNVSSHMPCPWSSLTFIVLKSCCPMWCHE